MILTPRPVTSIMNHLSRRVLALLSLAATILTIITALVWLSHDAQLLDLPGHPEGNAPSVPVATASASEEEVDALPVELNEEPRFQSGRAQIGYAAPAASSQILVLSSARLPLTVGERRSEQGSWIPLPSVGDALVLDSRFLPTEIRAPGHLAAQVTSSNSPVFLEPDMLLEVTGESLEDALASVYVAPDMPSDIVRERLLAVCTTGIVGCDRYCAAVDSRGWSRETAGGFDLNFVLVSGRVVHITCHVTPGLRAAYRLNTARALPSDRLKPIKVRVEGLSNPNAASIDVHIVAESEETLQAGSAALSVETMSWGTVIISGLRYAENFALGSQDGKELVLQPVPIGTPILLTVRDRMTGDYGRTAFRHEGNTVALSVLSGSSLCGAASSWHGAPRPKHLNLLWQFDIDTEDAWDPELPASLSLWGGQARDLPVDSTGRFSIVVPTTIPLREDSHWPLPTFMRVRVEAHGFRPRTVPAKMNALGMFDCGEVLLEPEPPDLELAPGHGLRAETLDEQGLSVLPSGRFLQFELFRALERSDGIMNLYLMRSPDGGGPDGPVEVLDLVQGTVLATEWSVASVDSVVIEYAPEVAAGFRKNGGYFERVPSPWCSVTVGYQRWPIEADTLYYGWTWNGIIYRMGVWRHREDGRREITLSFEAPVDAEFWISSAWQGPAAGEDMINFVRTARLASRNITVTL